MRRLFVAFLLVLLHMQLASAQESFYSPTGNLEIWMEKPSGYFTVAEWMALHPAATPEPGVIPLDETKASKKREIDINTNRIRDRDGLSFGGERFAMNDGAMLKWTGLMAAKDMLSFPFTILTIDDNPYVLQNHAALLGFLVAVMSYETAADSPLSTGRALRQRIESASSFEEVATIVDDCE